MRPTCGGRRRRCVVFARFARCAHPCGRRSRGSVGVCRRPRSSRSQKSKGFTSGCAALAFFLSAARGVSLARARQYLAPPLRLFPVRAPLAPRTARPRARLPLLSSRRSGACGSQARKRGGGACGARLGAAVARCARCLLQLSGAQSSAPCCSILPFGSVLPFCKGYTSGCAALAKKIIGNTLADYAKQHLFCIIITISKYPVNSGNIKKQPLLRAAFCLIIFLL